MDKLDSIIEYIDQSIPDCTELREVVRIFETVKGHQSYRFEVVHNVNSSDVQFDVEAYYRSNSVWKRWTAFPASYSISAEGALLRAMSWFREYSAKVD